MSSASGPDISCVGVVGLCIREGNSWWVLIICLVNGFHCFSMSPNDTHAVNIQEWCEGYAFSTGWNNTDSLLFHVVLMSAIMHAKLERRWVQIIYRWLCTRVIHLQSASVMVGKFVGGWWIFLLCQIVCQCFIVLLLVTILCPWHCMILSFQLPDFWCKCSVHHIQYGQFNIQASISSPTFLAVCSWSKLYYLSWMRVLLCLLLSAQSWSNLHLESS